MEYEIERSSDRIKFYKRGSVGSNKTCIIVYKDSFVPSDFDADRTARMIEKMEKVLSNVQSLLISKIGGFSVRKVVDDAIPWLIADLDYIENGKPTQTPKDMLKYLVKCHKEGNLLSVIGNYIKEIEELCAKEEKE